MQSLVIFASVLVCALAQYPYNHPGAGAAQAYSNPSPNQYAPSGNPGPSSQGAPASVHYVNIGAQLQGDYKFGYDTGRGSANSGQSFREETRLPDGTVKGAYGYVDASGQRRVIKYTAGKGGFVAEGDDVPKAPPAPAPVAPQGPAQPQYVPQQQPAYNQYNSAPNYNGNNDVSGKAYYDPNLLNYNIGNNPQQYQG